MNEPTHRAVTDGIEGIGTTDHGGGAPEDVSTSVVIAIAEAKEVDPVELEAPLHEFLDPDALDALVESMDYGRVTFDAAGTRVSVEADGTVEVTEE